MAFFLAGYCSDGLRFRAVVSFCSTPAVRACATAKSAEIARQGLPHEPEKIDSIMVNKAFHSHQHLDSEPE
jgi:hypothetical protein